MVTLGAVVIAGAGVEGVGVLSGSSPSSSEDSSSGSESELLSESSVPDPW